jgi:hypothetical protein
MGQLPNQPTAYFIVGITVTTDSFDNPLPQPIHRVTFASTYDSDINRYIVTSTVTFYVADPEPSINIAVFAYVSF